MPDVGGFMDAIFGITMLGIVLGFAVPIAIIAVIIWAIRRAAPSRDPAEEALRGRLARGEIDLAEFQVRMRALRNGDQT